MYIEQKLRHLNRSQLIFEAKKHGIKVLSSDHTNIVSEYICSFKSNKIVKNQADFIELNV